MDVLDAVHPPPDHFRGICETAFSRVTFVAVPAGCAWQGLRRGPPDGPSPDFGLYLGVDYQSAWQHEHLPWQPPRDAHRAAQLLHHVHHLARHGQRVEIACGGGRGRTGTALAAIATLAGVPTEHAVGWVRSHYDRHAVETPWQRRWVRCFPDLVRSSSPGASAS